MGDLELPGNLSAYEAIVDIAVAGQGQIGMLTSGTLIVTEVRYSGDLSSRVGGGTYAVAPMCYLATPLTSTSWDGDSKTSANAGTIDLSSVFSAPANIKAVLVQAQVACQAATNYVTFGPTITYKNALNLIGRDPDYGAEALSVVPCNTNGDIYVDVSGTAAVVLKIWGYAI
jgi:hypothetical protein